ncbi:MAG TPA: hypothetical protein VLG44_08210 [Chlamydiales bacterium]|nr:hypothetical protein [Chlamydiales bacterium]
MSSSIVEKTDWTKRVESQQPLATLKRVMTYSKPRGHISAFAPPIPKSVPPVAVPQEKKLSASISTIDLSKTYTLDEMLKALKSIKPPDSVIVNAKKITIKRSEFTDDEVRALHALSLKDDGLFIWFM